MDRNSAIKEIRTALRRRSGKSWSVTGGHGTAWGWIRITAPPKRLVNGSMTDEDRIELSKLLGLETVAFVAVHSQGESIPNSSAYYQEYIDRANGREPSVRGRPYWD